MKKNPLLIGFIATLCVAVFLRLFVLDVISVSNDSLRPHFFPGDFLLISKLSSVNEGSWVLLKDYPKQSVYSVRQLIEQKTEYIKGWTVIEPGADETKALIAEKKIVGKAIMILWSLPCKPSMSANGVCPDKSYRFLKSIP